MGDLLSYWNLISSATPTVQAVMIILFLLSIISWAVMLERMIFYGSARRVLISFEEEFWSGIDLNSLYSGMEDDTVQGVGLIFRSGYREFKRLRDRKGADADTMMASVQRGMRIALAREGEKLDSSLNFLATVGSTSPYLGLFGTVWGIMNAFRGLADLHHASLAVVAPGISEALIATAMGLFAAIPAVVAYNRFTTRANELYTRYQTFADEFSSILYRWSSTKT